MKKIWLLLMILGLLGAEGNAEQGWSEEQSENFKVYYRDKVPQEFVRTVLTEAQENFQRVSDNMGFAYRPSWNYDRRVSIYIYQDEKDYENKSQSPLWSHGATLVKSRTIVVYPEIFGFFDSILPHELAHMMLHEYIGDRIVPIWFDEGVAMYQEKSKRLGAHESVKEDMKNGKFITFNELNNMQLYTDTPQDVVLRFYQESASLINFMITQFGEQRFFKFLDHLKEGLTFDQALVKTYSRINTAEDLASAWVKYLEEE